MMFVVVRIVVCLDAARVLWLGCCLWCFCFLLILAVLNVLFMLCLNLVVLFCLCVSCFDLVFVRVMF